MPNSSHKICHAQARVWCKANFFDLAVSSSSPFFQQRKLNMNIKFWGALQGAPQAFSIFFSTKGALQGALKLYWAPCKAPKIHRRYKKAIRNIVFWAPCKAPKGAREISCTPAAFLTAARWGQPKHSLAKAPGGHTPLLRLVNPPRIIGFP